MMINLSTFTFRCVPGFTVLCLLALMLLTGGCAGINRCRETQGAILDISTVAASPGGDLLVGGTFYHVEHCFLELPGPRVPQGLVLSVSSDSGKTWSAVQIPRYDPEKRYDRYHVGALIVRQDGTIFAGITLWKDHVFANRENTARLLRSDDMGRSWSMVHDFGQDRLLSLAASADNELVAALCYQGIVRSDASGTQWTPCEIKVRASCSDLEVVSGGIGHLYAKGWGRNGPGVYRSTDGGRSWSRMPIPATQAYTALATNDHGEVMVTLSGPWQGDIYRSSDFGETWHKVSSPHEMWTQQLGVTAKGTLLVKAMDNLFAPGGGSFSSADGGKVWTRLNNLWTGANNIPGRDSLLCHPAGQLYAYEQIDFQAQLSLWDWGGHLYVSDDDGQSWRTLGPLMTSVPGSAGK